MFLSRYQIWLILQLSLYLYGCGQTHTKNIVIAQLDGKETVIGNFSQQHNQTFDSIGLDTFLMKFPLFRTYEDDIRKFYRPRNYAYAWFEGDTLIEHAGNLANRIAGLQNDGVYSRPPYYSEMDSLLHSSFNSKGKKMLEIMLTAQYFAFSRLAWDGMDDNERKANNWFLPRKRLSYNRYLDSLLMAPVKESGNMEPVYRQYELLKSFLKKYRELEKKGKWENITVDKPLKKGDSSDVVILLRNRLFNLGDLKDSTSGKVFDAPLKAALRNFQYRHGIKSTGIADKATLGELNMPLEDRIKQLLVNMERSRWLPIEQKGDYLAVNIPEFMLHVYHSDSLLWSCNVVVGQTMNRTTVFYGEIKYVVFSPYWNVPAGIVRSEIMPGIKKDPSYLESHRMEVVGRSDSLPIIRQRPGKNNALGLVKFLFPNSYNIYLHDTPSRSLFKEPSRAFSHGCIRVAEPDKLAKFLLQNYPEWTEVKIYQAMHSGKEMYVTLKEKVPVFIAYFTAFVDRENRLNFRKDIYNMDTRLSDMIFSGKGSY